MCVGAEVRLGAYEQGGASPRAYWHTGYPQLEPLFRRDTPPPLPVDPARKTVLYAPTWNLGLSSAGMLGGRVVELIRRCAGDVNVVIKPHPVIGDWRPRWMATWERRRDGTKALVDVTGRSILLLLGATIQRVQNVVGPVPALLQPHRHLPGPVSAARHDVYADVLQLASESPHRHVNESVDYTPGRTGPVKRERRGRRR